MKSIEDLKAALSLAAERRLIYSFYFHADTVRGSTIDIDFLMRDEATTQKIRQIRDYIVASYENVRDSEYMPLLHRLRIYLWK